MKTYQWLKKKSHHAIKKLAGECPSVTEARNVTSDDSCLKIINSDIGPWSAHFAVLHCRLLVLSFG